MATSHIFVFYSDSELAALDLRPLQVSTGSRGYFGNLGSAAESWHRMNREPRSDVMARA